jgi:CSLREA domain-containing protein
MRSLRIWTMALMVAVMTTAMLVVTPITHAEPQGFDFLVTRLDDPTPDGCNVGDCSLREAILAANTTAGSNAISITIPGTIELSLTGADEEVGATGDLDITENLYITGQGPEVTIVDANGLDRVFDFRPVPPVYAPQGFSNLLAEMTVSGGSVVADTDAAGGGVRVGPAQNVGLVNVVVRDNDAAGGTFGLGGGIANNGGSVFLDKVAVVNNSSENAGGIGNLDGSITIIRSTISGNTTIGAVGGILNLANTDGITATVAISDSTIAYNVEETPSGSGAGLDSTAFVGAAVMTVYNTIVANNVGDTQCYVGGDGVGLLLSSGYNLDTDSSCNFTAATDLQSTDPLLGALVQADGSYYHNLSNGSPALDSGSSFSSTDQRGATRPVDLAGIPNTDDGSDRGAIEMAAEPPTAVALSHLSVVSNDPFMVNAIAALAVALVGLVIALRRK